MIGEFLVALDLLTRGVPENKTSWVVRRKIERATCRKVPKPVGDSETPNSTPQHSRLLFKRGGGGIPTPQKPPPP